MPTQALSSPLSEMPLAPRARYDRLSMALHWTTLLLIILLFVTIRMQDNVQDDASAALLIALHRSAGMLLWGLTLLRLVWRRRYGAAVSLPVTTGSLQRLAAGANHALLYFLLLLQPMTGVLMSVSRGKPFILFGASFPALVARDKERVHFFHDMHDNGANILLGLIALHVVAAIFHGLRRDGVLGTMLPFGQRKGA